MLISGTNISKNYQGKQLFTDINFSIKKGDKIGLIGINGSGKSTLLKIIAGLEEPDYKEHQNDIEMRFAPRLKIAYLEQDPKFNDDLTIVQQVLEYTGAPEEYMAKSSLNVLGFEDYNLKVSSLSGGQRRKVALACALLKPADVLILDEPTNHLDENMTLYLENELKRMNKTLIMITHDRYFLDRITNQIYEIDNEQLYVYEGNYAYFCEQKAQRLEMDRASARKRSSLLRVEQKWINQGAKARGTKSKERIERFNKLKSIKVDIPDELDINSVNSRLGSQVIELENVGMSFDDKVLFQDFTYHFTKYDRVGILGLNGAGKSTLLNIIAQNIEPTCGTVTVGSTVKFGYFSQHTYHLPEEDQILEYIRGIAEYIETPHGSVSASQMLERFLFKPSLQRRQIKVLSGGEKRRLFLLSLIMQNPNVLILDEPTNDLDIDTLTVVEQYLDNFQGVVIVVSHDRYFLDKVVDKMFVFTPDKTIELYHGDYSSYVMEYNDKTKADPVKPQKVVKAKTNGLQKYKFTYKEQQEYNTIDEDIIELEERIDQLDRDILANGTNFEILNKLVTEREQAGSELDEKNIRWEYLMDLAEKIENGEYID
ncbi:ABC-F family ATP-binding cassette domain-containing protein [Mollicutes bacterium LVI A0039]|nr:ABC-F family ATP-binding cassette domain-containing protein [Mollicutes bacterium LVI A0039]